MTEPRFNQRLLEYQWDPTPGRAARLPSDTDVIGGAPVDVDDPKSVAAFVLGLCPEDPIVYPTERYYYFEFYAGSRRVAGNLRFTDAEKGLLDVGYFDRYDPTFLQSAMLGPEDGVDLVWDKAKRLARVSFRGRRRTFHLPQPEVAGSALLPNEDLVANVLDESGFIFQLLFHEPTSQFYFVLAPRSEPPEQFVRVNDDPPVDLGVRSRFVFLTEPTLGRRVLIGVYAPSVRANDYYDGPFDQVPPDLPIRPKLEASYPYVKLRGGIDEHGNFLKVDGQRVAISPYVDYVTVGSLLRRVHDQFDGDQESPACFAPLVYESKREAHLAHTTDDTAEQPRMPAPHQTEISRTWPVDHWAQVSRTWPSDHEQTSSLHAPANKPIDH
ncbi:MAG: hypothetical protein H6810_03010 [Phycisphaeraceae bacterium]|nr:MAG: hypothetical protein H6810_03010 [Phycisphaeraceae bacterium]